MKWRLLHTFTCCDCGQPVSLYDLDGDPVVGHPEPTCRLFDMSPRPLYLAQHELLEELQKLIELEQRAARARENYERTSLWLALLFALYLACGAVAVARADLVPALTWSSLFIAALAAAVAFRSWRDFKRWRAEAER